MKFTVAQSSMLYSCARFLHGREVSDEDIIFVKKALKYDTQPRHVRDIFDIMIGYPIKGMRDIKKKLQIIEGFRLGIKSLENPPHWYVDGTARGCNCEKCVGIRGKVDKHGRKLED